MEDALDQANAIWSSILNADQMKALGLSKEGGRQAKRHKPENKDHSRKGNKPANKPSYDDLVAMVARLALRTEESLQQLLQDHQFILHLQPGQGSMLPLMLATTQSWHNSSKDTPLRHQLVVLLISTLEERLTNLSKATPKDQMWIECQQLNLIDSEGNMPYLRWDPLARTLKPTKDATLKLDEGTSCSAEHPSLGPRPHNDHSFSWTEQAFRVDGPSHPIFMDDIEPQSGRDLERSQTSLLSCHLAVGEDLHSTTRNREEQSGQEHPSTGRQRTVRILMNPGNICFANAFVVCQAWVTILAGAMDPTWWPLGGFELFRSVTTASVLPLNLLIFQPFLWLLIDGWTITDMDRQQDVAEFAHWFLMRTQPLFVNCEWVARFLRDGLENDPSVRHEQGHRFGLISLHINPQHDTCSLQNLIDSLA